METKRNFLSHLKEWGTIAFAAPATLLLLGKFDDRLDFSEFLERIILGVSKFSYWVWSLVNASDLHFVLSLYAIVFGICLKTLITNRAPVFFASSIALDDDK